VNILVTLSVDTIACLQFITDIEDNNFINLYNTYFSIWLKRKNKRFCLRKQAVGYDLYYFVERIQDCIENKRNFPLVLGEKVDLGLLLNNHNQKIILSQETGMPLKDWRWIGDEFLFFENNADGFNSL
tara:strand:+ start:1332 stop:1715 length:384 start_codon:yes stop_codon:yes gene_type:complete